MEENPEGMVREPSRRGRKPGSKNKGNPEMLQATGGLPLSISPTTADELAQAWQIPSGEAPKLSVKVMRQIIGSAASELVTSIPLIYYDLGQIAGKYGPGLYYLRGGGSKIVNRVLKVTISEDFARENGFGRIPEQAKPQPPMAQDILAVRTLEQASAPAGIDPGALVAAIERAAERVTERALEARFGQSAMAMPWQNPADMMKAQMEATERQMDFMARIEERVRRSMTGEPVKSGEDDFSLSGILKTLAPALPGIIQAITQPRPQPPPPQSRPIPAPVQHPQGPAPVALPPAEEPQTIAIPEEPPMVEISHEDQQIISPAVSMLRPFAGMLSRYSQDTRPASEIAEELFGYVPPALYPALQRMGEITAEKGPEVLMLIGHQFRSERWAAIMQELGRIAKECLTEDDSQSL